MACSGPRLTLHQIGQDRLHPIEQEYYTLRWNRDGEVRTVPRHVVENVLREYHDELKRGVLNDVTLSRLHGFRWEQAV